MPAVRTVICEDADHLCDRDRLIEGRGELWVRLKLPGLFDRGPEIPVPRS